MSEIENSRLGQQQPGTASVEGAKDALTAWQILDRLLYDRIKISSH